MTPFLEHVAHDILTKYGTDLSRLAVVFPNKRASLFLNDHLARLADRPIWSPAYFTISDLFRQCSERTVADPLKLVCDLHRSFVAQTGNDETLDHFFGWGQLLLSDFDDLDKHLALPDKVLANVRDLHELDDVSYLTPQQRDVIRQFFGNFSDDHNSMLKERFLRLWSHMADIYTDFNQRLAQQQLGYEGAIYKEVVEHPEQLQRLKASATSTPDVFLFVGFNLLLPVEQRLFDLLQREGRARFYWDYDRYYTDGNNEAGLGISQCLHLFPNELDDADDSLYDNFRQPKTITFIAAPTENIQARYVTQWLRQPQPLAPASPPTAVVLCNEALLPSVVHALPPEAGRVNITTGYPLAQSPVASLLAHLLALRTQGYDTQHDRYRLRQVSALLRHPYLTHLTPHLSTLLADLTEQHVYHPTPLQLTRGGSDAALQLLFRPFDGGQPLVPQLLTWLCDVVQATATLPADNADTQVAESLFRAYTLLNRLRALVDSGDLSIDTATLQRLVTQLVQTTTIPFEGEPVEGLQVMGMLETRCLDFQRVLLLSAGEGNLPRGVSDTSFIPFSIRKAYGLTTPDRKVALQSYYFHRLLQRASEVTIVYNNTATDGQRGEMSRFMLQLMVESPHTITFRTLRAPQRHTPFQPPTVEKTPDVINRLTERFATPATSTCPPSTGTLPPLLTPTAINRYQRCPLQFYYCYVHGLREPDETDDDVIDNRIFGNIFHEAARLVYTRLTEQSPHITARDIDHLLHTRVDIERAVDQAIAQELFRQDSLAHHTLNGLQIINRAVIIRYVRMLLQLDRRLTPFTIVGLECDVISPMRIAPLQLTTTIGGRIDRLDLVTDADGTQRLRVIDYKTGASRPRPLADVDAIFRQDSLAQHSDYYLQTFLYACLVRAEHRDTAVSPALLFIQHAGADDYDPTLCFGRQPIRDVADSSARFGELLRQTVDTIFDPATPFTPTDDRNRCRTCPYAPLCRL